jgi:hypothetical protein
VQATAVEEAFAANRFVEAQVAAMQATLQRLKEQLAARV